MTLEEWLDAYMRFWTHQEYSRSKVEMLFTEDAVYRPNVLTSIERPYRGHDEILEYMERICPEVVLAHASVCEPIRAGDRVAVEIWVYGVLEGREETEAMCTVLSFAPDGRCTELRDYVQLASGVEAPFDGWN